MLNNDIFEEINNEDLKSWYIIANKMFVTETYHIKIKLLCANFKFVVFVNNWSNIKKYVLFYWLSDNTIDELKNNFVLHKIYGWNSFMGIFKSQLMFMRLSVKKKEYPNASLIGDETPSTVWTVYAVEKQISKFFCLTSLK